MIDREEKEDNRKSIQLNKMMDKEEKKIFREKRENLWRNNEKKSFLM